MRPIVKIAITIALMCLPAVKTSGQHYIGARGGYGAGYGRFEDKVVANYRYDQRIVWGLWNGAFTWKYYGPQKYIGGVGAEIEFLQRAYEYSTEERKGEKTYRRVINTVNVPLIWQPHINMANNTFRAFFTAGIAASYNINSRVDSLTNGKVTYSAPYKTKFTRDNPFGFGLQFGLGFNVIMGKWEFSFEGRYYFTYGDILRNSSKYPGDDANHPNPRRSPVDNFNLSLGFYYRLGNEPHAPPPSPAAIRRQAAKAAKREAKQLEKMSGNGE